jgi:hypothetical protein
VGGGLGSFDPLYRSVESLETLDPTFLNHAHNDYRKSGSRPDGSDRSFSSWFSSGWRRPASVCARDGEPADSPRPSSDDRDRLLLAHSAVEYPLRTPALAVVFAFACGLLVRAGRPVEQRSRRRRD